MILYFLEYPAIPNILKYKVLEGSKYVPKCKAFYSPLDKKDMLIFLVSELVL